MNRRTLLKTLGFAAAVVPPNAAAEPATVITAPAEIFQIEGMVLHAPKDRVIGYWVVEIEGAGIGLPFKKVELHAKGWPIIVGYCYSVYTQRDQLRSTIWIATPETFRLKMRADAEIAKAYECKECACCRRG